LVGLAPFYIRVKTRWGVVRVREVCFLGTGEVCSDYLDVVALEGREDEVLKAFLAFLLGARKEWDRLVLTDIPEDSPTVKLLPLVGRQKGLRAHIAPWTRCPYVLLPEKADDVPRLLGSASRKELRKDRRRLMAEGTLEFQVASDPADAARQLEVLIKLHQASWQARGQPGHFSSERFAAFHRAVVPKLAASGRLYLGTINLNGDPIRAEYGFFYRNKAHAYLPGFEPAWGKFSIGFVYTAFALEYAISKGFTEFDFLQGAEEYKYRWTSTEHRNVKLTLSSTGIRGLLLDGLDRGWALAKGVLGSLGRKKPSKALRKRRTSEKPLLDAP
jgi:hypothetical protein